MGFRRNKMTTKDEALKMAHTTFMQINERFPRRDNGDGYFDKEITACKEALEQPTRLEVIDANGRTYTNWKVKELQFSYQDNGKTLKIFVTEVQND